MVGCHHYCNWSSTSLMSCARLHSLTLTHTHCSSKAIWFSIFMTYEKWIWCPLVVSFRRIQIKSGSISKRVVSIKNFHYAAQKCISHDICCFFFLQKKNPEYPIYPLFALNCNAIKKRWINFRKYLLASFNLLLFISTI